MMIRVLVKKPVIFIAQMMCTCIVKTAYKH